MVRRWSAFQRAIYREVGFFILSMRQTVNNEAFSCLIKETDPEKPKCCMRRCRLLCWGKPALQKVSRFLTWIERKRERKKENKKVYGQFSRLPGVINILPWPAGCPEITSWCLLPRSRRQLSNRTRGEIESKATQDGFEKKKKEKMVDKKEKRGVVSSPSISAPKSHNVSAPKTRTVLCCGPAWLAAKFLRPNTETVPPRVLHQEML